MNTHTAHSPTTPTHTPSLPHHGTTERVSRIRATIAKRMLDSLDTSAQLTATVEVDCSAISDIRREVKQRFREQEGVGLSYLPFIVHAAVEALRDHPKLNATIDLDAGVISHPDGEHIGIAVDTPRGLLVPVIRDTATLSVRSLATAIAGVASRAQAGKLTAGDLAGGTFTVTNYGSVGTLFDTPIINQPQVAILGTGALTRRPAVIQRADGSESIEARDMMYLSLSYDHRLVDGADAARFLGQVKARLEAGEFDV
ncbi:2-oxo acid dehydrogenase subunit E2 [Leucobacter aridicollis]|uniref:2-oxo acid dehydrogenase subunit E2 n=1 Tax=Leucobacter aridicollis TaxID=283878 RepID=UPI000E64E545|nr:2-oxo acid dehydrogenase subunit E2 [Leucobacter aridicollis]UTX54034.1 2-oxo acid dehydrogenase subunit E2 [Leucobacter aridicollis]